MDFAYSPHREGCGTMHLPSPTHPHNYRLEGTHFSHLQQLRRSLSRSPSKPSRFQMRNSDSPRSPISPLALTRAFSPKQHGPTSPVAAYPESPLAQTVPAKKKFTIRRSAPFRSSPRTRNSKSKSPHRVLADSTETGNSTPFTSRNAPGQENTPEPRSSVDHPDMMDTDRYGLNDKPIKFEFARRPEPSPAPIKSSPLKRNDGVMNLSGGTGSSPVAKRRSLYGIPSLGNDFESIFDQPNGSRASMQEPQRTNENESFGGFAFSSPINNTQSPLRRGTSLRKSTLSQRSTNTPRPKPAFDGEFAFPGAAASKTRNRMSLDGSMGQNITPSHTPFRKSTFDPERMGLPQPFVRSSTGAVQPHPLSHAHTPSSSSAFSGETPPMAPPRARLFGAPPTPAGPSHQFSRSLPIGVGRPYLSETDEESEEAFDTPFKVVQPPPVAFSTGLLSKKNRNVNDLPGAAGRYIMPDTPSKRLSYPPAAGDRAEVIDTPLVKRGGSLFGNSTRPQPQFGTTSTPFSSHVSKFSTESFGTSTNIFGNMGSSHQRRGSFVSVDGDDDVLPDSQSPSANRMIESPTANRMVDSLSGTDDTPPTPTKSHGGSSRRSKESSLRRKTFRQRPSIGENTFAVPEIEGHTNGKSTSISISTCSPIEENTLPGEELHSTICGISSSQTLSFARTRLLRQSKKLGRPSPLSRRALRAPIHSYVKNVTKQPPAAAISFGASSPQSPSETMFAPDTRRLSLSGNRRGSINFNSSLDSFPPATPTASRDHSVFFSNDQSAIPIGLTKNDVDESLASRFREVKELDGGEGEFSIVYRVSQPVKTSPERSPAGSQVWVVKKSKKTYIGMGDRQRKMREVEVLYALRGNDHVLSIKDHWEHDARLYIQTEYCESGNLRRFLDTTGFSGRLDDFRIWKILMELSMGLTFIHNSGYIHLDLKPANILIDFEGGLKIADFGLASPWPAPKHIDGEGDRHYLAPEALSGRFDKPADVFALGMMLAEIAGNCVIPENGAYWQKLRSGEFENVLPSLTWSAESSTLSRDSNGDPVTEIARTSMDGFMMSDSDFDSPSSIQVQPASNPEKELARAPKFMIDREDMSSMDQVVMAMLHPIPDQRPTAEQVLQCFGCQWVQNRRRSGATVYEGNFGPSDEMLATYDQDRAVDVEDMMDMS
ncbi:hypothetical protein P153DRAFT_278677 [Dothidotthia symphoricarpi CBS 119687]|uniref:Protein kinase domain-containing protein n=1 Tax=Dothidotthia symphoricarpi CBS 119687 TaxID=1392245 RepID=A0A6A6AUY6_9PLEO|nr:uncharacterized protein P153DRAFT_278677 [Dothidotthia symphoricarpi CBS 119687]KAF2135008.1 hypothetical protein P153DRAFT_278677 [Dothidotthia symphoricarpi CBS 119687]